MKKYLFALLPLIPVMAEAQPKVKELVPKTIPSEVSYNGDLVQAIKWEDKVGENIVVISETPSAQSITRPEKGYYEAALDARHFVREEEHWRPRWTLHDQVNECNLQIAANFVQNTFDITDLDNNGIAEVWLVYKVGCYGKNRPSFMKVIMYESETRYSMKGLTDVGAKGKYGGNDRSFDANFNKGPAIFREHATQLWDDNVNDRAGRYKPRQFK
ncbi:hypothetical protein GCM10023093_30190 [Nemorincola caseinilytica]|uniref:Uncharacterized protein n=1 Tax=Nemorincola caseinilytica TaxID=2054315 RepID=A0ABP8NS19_9BACT